ncbi:MULTISPECIES: superinfection immunity protein [unclassified Sphingomonas]|uniref:superinfection immunity protein n=1 Tax=unclassified Sphingomonas TaxID=196159 RepID=UPI0009EA1CA7
MITNVLSGEIAVIALVLIAAIVPLPSIVAKARRHPNRREIYALNVALIWTNIGWILLLGWAISGRESKRLSQLREKFFERGRRD